MAEIIFDINTIVQGNNGNKLPISLKNAGSIEGATVRIAIKRGAEVFTKQAVITDAAAGKCEVTLSAVDLPTSGLYFYQPTITYADGREFTGDVGRFTVGGKLSGQPPVTIPVGIDLNRLGISPSGFLTIDGVEQVGGEGSNVVPSQTNGKLKVNNVDVTVYDDSAITASVSALETDVNALKQGGTGGGSVPSNVILFEDWVGGESVTIDTGTTPPADTTAPVLTISPAGGNFASTQGVTMTTNETANIYYTLDGSTPTTASSKYTAALSLSATTTLKAFAVDTAGNSSAVQTVTFTKDVSAPADTTAPIVTVSPAAGTYTSAQTVTLTANETATIYYTTNGTTPTTASSVYSAPIQISATTTIQYMAKDTAGNQSVPVAATYMINIPQADTTAPVLTMTAAATFTDSQTVNMSANETADIWYTVDGSDPKTSGTRVKYSAPVTLTATTTVKAYAVDTAGNASGVQTAVYTKQAATAQVVVYPENGYLVMPVNRMAKLLGGWTVSVSFTNESYTSVINDSAFSSSLFDTADLANLVKIGNIPYVDYGSLSTTNSECLTMNNNKPIIKTYSSNGADKDAILTYLQNAYGNAKAKLKSTYGAYTITSNISNVSTRATSNNGGQYFKCTLLDGLGTYTGGAVEQFNSLGYDMQPSYSWTHLRENIKINADGTLEMVVPSGTFITIDQSSVSAYLASKNIKVYY